MYAIRGSAIFAYDELFNITEALHLDVEWVKSNKIETLEDLEAPAHFYNDLLDSIKIISGGYKDEQV